RFQIDDGVVSRVAVTEDWEWVVRISANGSMPEGLTKEDLATLANWMKEHQPAVGARGEKIYRIPVNEKSGARAEEAVRLHFHLTADGRGRIQRWHRYAETNDPHMTTNRPSMRNSLPADGTFTVDESGMTVSGRGVGMRSFLPASFLKTEAPVIGELK